MRAMARQHYKRARKSSGAPTLMQMSVRAHTLNWDARAKKRAYKRASIK